MTKNSTSNLKTQGFILLDVDVVALNNAGKSHTSNFDNAVATKKIRKNSYYHTYVSGQAWRYWWRNSLQQNFGWELSPIIREKKVAFTESNPIKYADDDIFGYMKAAREVIKDEKGNPVKDTKGNEKTENVTVTRVSPLKNSAVISVAATQTEENWSSMARQDGDSVPYSKEEYSAIMKGMFSLDLDQVGTFADYNKTGFKNLTKALKREALLQGAETLDDSYQKDAKGSPMQLIRLKKEIRLKRAIDTIKALKTISGGAMQTNNMTDVTPKFIILSTTNTGNHPFTHIVKNSGSQNQVAELNIDGLEEVVQEYNSQFKGNIFIGKRSGFLDEFNKELQELADKHENISLHPVNEAIDKYCEQLANQL